MPNQQTQMRREVLEIPSAVDRLLKNGSDDIAHAADALRAQAPSYLVSVACLLYTSPSPRDS